MNAILVLLLCAVPWPNRLEQRLDEYGLGFGSPITVVIVEPQKLPEFDPTFVTIDGVQVPFPCPIYRRGVPTIPGHSTTAYYGRQRISYTPPYTHPTDVAVAQVKSYKGEIARLKAELEQVKEALAKAKR